MMGAELNASIVTERGLVGDRACAIVDAETGKVASAKEPRKWSKLFEHRSAYVEPPEGNGLPPIRITLPDGTAVTTESTDLGTVLSETLARPVAFASTAPDAPSLEEYWPDIEGLDYRDVVTDEAMPAGTFFDLAMVHLLTTATIDRLPELYPQGRFEPRRFRSNVLVTTEERGFAENDWVGSALAVREEVRLQVTGPCPRCVMTTLAQATCQRIPASSGRRRRTTR